MASSSITTLFLDVGGVLITNGWDRGLRRKAAEKFGLDYAEMDQRHHLTFDTYESGKLSLSEFWNRVVFYQPRAFTPEEFKQFVYGEYKPFPQMLDLVRQLKERHKVKTIVVSNEGREFTDYRIERFNLREIIDAFIVSSFVHLRKPDVDIYRMALDVAQTPPGQVAYLDDRLMFVEVARSLGIQAIHHKDYETTKAALAALGLTL
jgi:putative hydrolase of the HAD superfamily